MNTFLLLTLLVLPAAELPAGKTSAGDAARARIVIDGDGIEAVELRDVPDMQRGTTQRLKIDRSGLALAPGHYQLRLIYTGGYPAIWQSVFLTRDKPYHLKSQWPLRPTVEVKRQGRLLTMDYKLLDSAGRSCLGDSRDYARRPAFVIRYDGREVASGDFEYG